jgi:hypothetical protein
MACVLGRTQPDLWSRSKRAAIKRMGGRFSARAMQLAGKLYRDAGGGYCGSRTRAQRSLTKWTGEKWTTATGAKACRGDRCDRYLPAAAWAKLSPGEKAATRRKKLKSKKQWVKNTPAAARAGRKARR